MSIKTERVARLIKNRVATILLHEINDPRMGFVTVTKVEITPDFKIARVHVSVLGDDGEQSRTMHGLTHAAKHIQRLVGRGLRTRSTPVLEFVQDRSVERSIELSRLIDRAVAGEDGDAEPVEWPLYNPGGEAE